MRSLKLRKVSRKRRALSRSSQSCLMVSALGTSMNPVRIKDAIKSTVTVSNTLCCPSEEPRSAIVLPHRTHVVRNDELNRVTEKARDLPKAVDFFVVRGPVATSQTGRKECRDHAARVYR